MRDESDLFWGNVTAYGAIAALIVGACAVVILIFAAVFYGVF